MAPVIFKTMSATRAENIKVPVITNKVINTSFHPIFVKSFKSFPREIPANAPSAVAGGKNATGVVVSTTISYTGETGHARSSPRRDTYIIEGSLTNRLINLLIVRPIREIALSKRTPIMESFTGIL